MSMNVETGNRLMDRISKELGLSECGKDWVTAAIDPYHDTPLDHIMGYPDINEAASVIQVVKTTYQISVPSSAGSGNWDCHIASLPWLVQPTGSLFATSYQPGLFVVNNSPPNPVSNLGGLCYDAVPAGTETFSPITNTIIPLDSATNATYAVNEWRQIAHGFEVINTTSELNIQGLCTCYRAPWPARDTKSTTSFYNYVSSGAGALAFGFLDTITGGGPPQTTAKAMLYPGSVQWKAKDGAYVVPTLNSSDLPAGSDNTTVIVKFGDETLPVAYGPNQSGTFTVPPSAGSALSVFYNNAIELSDFNIGGAYFTGLSNSTTLTVNCIRYFERFPTVDFTADAPLVVLGKPSCRNDPQAQELYSAVIRHMPVGVPQRFNGIGDWFREAVQTARDIVAPVLSAIPNPIAQFGSGILKGIAGNIDKKYNQEEKTAVVPAGQIYNSQGNQSRVVLQPKRTSVAKQMASMKIGAKKKKTKKMIVAAVAKK